VVAESLGCSRNTVRRYREGAEAGKREGTTRRSSPKAAEVRPRLEELLAESKEWTQGKQQLTATRARELLRDRGVTVGTTLVRSLMRELERKAREVFVPLVYAPGDLAEVDFFEVFVDLAGERHKAYLFVMRLMYSGRDFAWLYPRQDQVAFLNGHVRAFEHFGGVPLRSLYDNLKPAVKKLVGNARDLTTRFLALVAHYQGFEPCFARPGEGHDKGGVEARGRAIRLQELVPIPQGPDLGTVSADLLRRLDAKLDPERWAIEKARLTPLPRKAFRAARSTEVSVSRRALAQVEGASYSVPEAWADLVVTAYVGVDDITFVGPRDEQITRRRIGFGERLVDYKDYLRTLSTKPQAVRQVVAELVRDLGPPFAHVWRQLVDLHEPKKAAQVFTKLLAVAVERGIATVAQRLQIALEAGETLDAMLFASTPAPASIDPEALPPSVRDVVVEAARAADFDQLLDTGGHAWTRQ